MQNQWSFKKTLIRLLIVVPPVLFLFYTVNGLRSIRSLLSDSSKFHMDYANDLIQEYLAFSIEIDVAHLETCLAEGEPCESVHWVTLDGNGDALQDIQLESGRVYPVYLRHDVLASTLPDYFNRSKSLSAMFSNRSGGHEPVYWFRILAPDGNVVYQSGPRPTDSDTKTIYDMDSSLANYQIEVVYNSFGARQLYSVSRQKINFGLIFFLFLMAIFSVVLFTRVIRQKIVLAKQKTFFVSTVSHEFKTPLAIMKLAAETLESKRFKKPEDEKRFLKMLDNEINRLNHLVQKILNYSKIEMGQIAVHKVIFDLRDVIQASLDIFQARATAEDITLEASLHGEPCMVEGDPELIRHAIDNILDNAFKYHGESDHIEVLCERDDQEIRLHVRDHGVGIPQDELPNITRSFYRIDDPKIRGIRGSGLGLAISNYLLKHARAVLRVDSELDRGSTFTIAFPVNA